MVSLDELRGELIATREDYKKSDIDPNLPNQILSASSDYAFECQCCKEAAPWLNPYRIIKGTLTTFEFAMAGLARGTRKEDIKSTEGIVRISELDSEPEYDSALNWVEGTGYVCDHCYKAVYHDD